LLTPPTKNVLREDSMRKWQIEWLQNSDTGGWTRRLVPDLRPWVLRSFGTVNYHITQFLTGHGCLDEYLWRFKKLDFPVCHDCQAPVDDDCMWSLVETSQRTGGDNWRGVHTRNSGEDNACEPGKMECSVRLRSPHIENQGERGTATSTEFSE